MTISTIESTLIPQLAPPEKVVEDICKVVGQEAAKIPLLKNVHVLNIVAEQILYNLYALAGNPKPLKYSGWEDSSCTRDWIGGYDGDNCRFW